VCCAVDVYARAVSCVVRWGSRESGGAWVSKNLRTNLNTLHLSEAFDVKHNDGTVSGAAPNLILWEREVANTPRRG
jgi:hypothetical protein